MPKPSAHSLRQRKPGRLERLDPIGRLRAVQEYIWHEPESGSWGPGEFLRPWLQILDRSFYGYFKHASYISASGLTYTTLITIVPLLAILLPILKGFNLHERAEEELRRLPQLYILPSKPAALPSPSDAGGEGEALALPTDATTAPLTTDDAAGPGAGADAFISMWEDTLNKVFSYVDNTDVSQLGFLGFAGLIVAVMMLLSRIEASMNNAWGVQRSRSIARKLVDYERMIVFLVLLLIGLGLSRATPEWASRLRVDNIMPYAFIWFAFIFINYYLPNTRVRWPSALVGGLVSGTVFQLAQVVLLRFSQLVLTNYNKIYGAFAAVLLVLLWVYLSWSIVLWGVEISSAHQNLRNWWRSRRNWRGTPHERETLALRLAVLLAAPMLGRPDAHRMDNTDLADALALPLEPVNEMLETFAGHNLVVQSAEDGTFILARSPEELTALDLLRLVRQGSLEPRQVEHTGPFAVAPDVIERLRTTTVRSLADTPREQIESFAF